MADPGDGPPTAHSTGVKPAATGPGVRSMVAFSFGVILFAVGVATVVSELSPLELDQTLSVGALAAGVVLLVALVAAPRRPRLRGGAGTGPTASGST